MIVFANTQDTKVIVFACRYSVYTVSVFIGIHDTIIVFACTQDTW